MSMSPTERTLAYLRKLGYSAVVTERWNPFAKIRQDLFGIVDVLAVRRGETLAVQCTSATNVAARVNKIAAHESTPRLREAGWRLEVHGWRKGTPEPRVVDVS
jgi:carbonic anhydrase